MDAHGMNNPEICSFDTPAQLEVALAEVIVAQLREAIETRGEAGLILAGGSTPVALYERLSHAALDWSRVRVTLSDERWVAEDDRASNAAMVKRHLLRHRAACAIFLPLYNAAPDPASGADETERVLAALPATADVVLLGMGEDGHTASLFADAPELAGALDPQPRRDCAAQHPPGSPQPRLTLTLPRLLASRRVCIQIVGHAKWQTLQQAQAPGPVETMPVRALLRQQQTPVSVYWSP
jgi:6-phosphogluconolactonase